MMNAATKSAMIRIATPTMRNPPGLVNRPIHHISDPSNPSNQNPLNLLNPMNLLNHSSPPRRTA